MGIQIPKQDDPVETHCHASPKYDNSTETHSMRLYRIILQRRKALRLYRLIVFAFLAHKVGGAEAHKHGDAAAQGSVFVSLSAMGGRQ